MEVQTQVVAGTNYKACIKIDSIKFLNVKVYEPLPYTKKAPTVTGSKTGDKCDLDSL